MKTAMEMLEEFICLNNYTEIDLVNKIQELLPIEKKQIENYFSTQLIDGIEKDAFIIGILMNIEDYMPKAKRKRTTNIRIIQDYLLRRTNKGGRTSAFEQCFKLNIDPEGFTFYKK